ncbi:hypothetical protein [Dactylosporangium sp. CA-233914]|uniref:hypothetical protein n=1 Tax=Dactylosporangium sp. CA-233914 TaxID=3239934 RepID=UPI003D8B0384
MGLRESGRVGATVFAVTTFAAVVAAEYFAQPWAWRLGPTLAGFAVGYGSFLLAVAGPFLLYLWLNRPLRRPATFRRDGGAFVAGYSPPSLGMIAVVLMLNATSCLPAERVPDADQVPLTTLGVRAPLLALAGVLVLAALAVIWVPRARLVLTPAGVEFRGRAVAWGDLLPDGPWPRQWSMPLLYRDGDGRTRKASIPTALLDIDHAFVADAIRHYAEHPRYRSGIGTEAELERLVSAQAAGQGAAQRWGRGGQSQHRPEGGAAGAR